MSAKNNVLFISYDGMTDPLGQSQVLPYLFGISDAGKYDITVLSCEKKKRFSKNRELIKEICDQHNVDWQYVFFHVQPPIISKLYDIFLLKKKAANLVKKKKITIVHCRSYIAIEVGLFLKNKFNCKVIFDMRGFWVDERVDGGLWDTKKYFYKLIYSLYKKKEIRFLCNSDHIISLTNAGKNEIEKWIGYNSSVPISVIPCAADVDLFTLTSPEQKLYAKEMLNYKKEDFIISYLGTLGTWYMLDEMLCFFVVLKSENVNAKFLFISSDDESIVFDRACFYNISKDDIKIVSLERKDVPVLIKASEFSLFFIKPAYSKIASSPTKLGELLMMGIPVITNSLIGDVDNIVAQTNAGIIISSFNNIDYRKAIGQITGGGIAPPNLIREKAFGIYSLEKGVSSYLKVYDSLVYIDSH